MNPFRWLYGMWLKHLRVIDVQILWPTCLEQAGDLDKAKAMFAVHAFNDHAYSDLTEAQIVEFIDRLQ